MDENNKPQSDFDLDAALAEKFQQVQQDADRLRSMNDNTDTPASSPVPEPTEVPQEQPEPETGSPAPEPEEPAEEFPQFDIGETPEKPAATTEEDKAAAKERKARYKLKRQILITNRIGAVVRIFAIGTIIFGGLDLPAGWHTPHGIRRGKPKACHTAQPSPSKHWAAATM